MNFGKAGAVRKDHRKRIGFAPWKYCNPGVEALESELGGSRVRLRALVDKR
jgi:hypothetical protein